MAIVQLNQYPLQPNYSNNNKLKLDTSTYIPKTFIKF